jgi:hypothetical protein
MLSVVILNVVGLNVMAPTKGLGLIILMHSVNIAVQILDLRLDDSSATHCTFYGATTLSRMAPRQIALGITWYLKY